MVTPKQKSEIEKRMRRIKDAKDDGMDQRVIEKRTQELYRYLASQGLLGPLQ